MKRKLPSVLLPVLSLLAWANNVSAEGTDTTPKSLSHAILNSIIFATIGIVVVFVGFKVFDWAVTKIDIEKELLNNNVAVAIVTAAVIIGISIIVATSIM
ncbi:DUF350 domain-containing protein [Pedosphaera parvula]|uniref:DUF350 domain-containing protein n=1 Tax=Pedosphaera parvula (strain Ellin514) TaxID=320771 RepID=B9XE62_PEDPL|nr:DUF350 domain-containing protein [Pedosphaera parvula]EEF61953.1 protein of unknown function DUF350 [Pedosphaera parvula Ellin514]